MSPSPHDSALRILRNLRARNIQAGEAGDTTLFVEPFHDRDWNANAFSAGLQHAVEQKWVTVENGGTAIRLTEEGAAQLV